VLAPDPLLRSTVLLVELSSLHGFQMLLVLIAKKAGKRVDRVVAAWDIALAWIAGYVLAWLGILVSKGACYFKDFDWRNMTDVRRGLLPTTQKMYLLTCVSKFPS